MTTQLIIPENHIGNLIQNHCQSNHCSLTIQTKITIQEILKSIGDTIFVDAESNAILFQFNEDIIELTSMGVSGNLRTTRDVDIHIHCEKIGVMQYQLVIESPAGNQELTEQIATQITSIFNFTNRKIIYDMSHLI